MTRMSVVILMAAVALSLGPAAALAQRTSPPPGTNSAGTAQSSGGAPNREPGVTTGAALGTGNAAPPPTPSGDAAINQENATIGRKLKGICRGC